MFIYPFGYLEFIENEMVWFGRVNNINPDCKIELSISVLTHDEDFGFKVTLVKDFAREYSKIKSNLFDIVYESYKNTIYAIDRNDIEKMYFLGAVHLKDENPTWWLTLEPEYHVKSVYNHFFRFTMIGNQVTWHN